MHEPARIFEHIPETVPHDRLAARKREKGHTGVSHLIDEIYLLFKAELLLPGLPGALVTVAAAEVTEIRVVPYHHERTVESEGLSQTVDCHGFHHVVENLPVVRG